ncbi:hypothetical protein L9F63_010160 [Diploptera punctata]|uniref:DNA/RNA non-specific endonuclease/pyrophosphatase/phosphodiesterase domain-containing protein n=1 Tax=Diploptera punctata TaxID=6984 RepID=A0AAD8ERG8_DIPPU|nr:hypothetical protein L9F63_010160 [Diploptera punctata]
MFSQDRGHGMQLLLHLFIIINISNSVQSACRIDINADLSNVSRMILHPYSSSTDGYRFYLPPAGQGSLNLLPNQELAFACPLGLYEHARCVSGTAFEFSTHSRQLNVSDITCRRQLKPIVRNLGKCNNNEFNHLGVGVTLRIDSTTHEFIKLMDFCFNPILRIPQYAKFLLMQGVENGQRNVKRQNFTCSTFFGNLSQNFEEIYNKRNQYQKLNQLLGSRNLTEKYLNMSASSDLFLAKGHLAAFIDFVYYSQQQATAICENTAPMWQALRKNNWRKLENMIRQYANENGIDLTIYSGTYNVLRLNNTAGEMVPIFLTIDTEGRNIVPVPQLFWKIVYDRLMRQGIVFVLINNHDSNLTPSHYEVCQDVCNRTDSWFQNLDRKQIQMGYIYCCNVNDFLEATNVVSEFREIVVGLLT